MAWTNHVCVPAVKIWSATARTSVLLALRETLDTDGGKSLPAVAALVGDDR